MFAALGVHGYDCVLLKGRHAPISLQCHAVFLQLVHDLDVVKHRQRLAEICLRDHVDHRHGLSFHAQHNGTFQAHNTTAADYYIFAYRNRMVLHVLYGLHVGAVYSGHSGNDVVGAGSHDDGIGILLQHHFSGDLGIQVNVCAAALGLSNVPLLIEPEIFLKGRDGGILHQPAQLTGLFIQVYLMSHFSQGLCRHHAAWPAADDHHVLLPSGLYQALQIHGLAQQRIDGTAHGRSVVIGCTAPVTAGAGTNQRCISANGFVDQIAVCHIGLCHHHNVGLSPCNDVLRLLERGDVAHHCHGDMQPPLCLCRKFHIESPFLEIGGGGIGGGVVKEDHAAGDMHNVDKLLGPLHKRQ